MAYVLLAVIAASGFVASFACDVMGWFHVQPPLGRSVFILHVGFIALWFPLVTFANRTMPKGAKNNLEHLLAEFPPWLRRVSTLLFIYALLNFAYFMYCTGQYPKHELPFYIELRGFSGHWMLFYGMATMGFIALARIARRRKQSEAGL